MQFWRQTRRLRRHCVRPETRVSDFDTTKNLFIEGDNLDALKLLQETYLGKSQAYLYRSALQHG